LEENVAAQLPVRGEQARIDELLAINWIKV